MRFLLVFLMIVSAVLCGGIVFIVVSGSPLNEAATVADALYGSPVSSETNVVHFHVSKGETADDVGNRLASLGLIRSELAFRLVVRSRGVGGAIEAGDTSLRPNMSLDQIVDTLQHSHDNHLFTVPEGWRALQIANALNDDQIAAGGAFMNLVLHPTVHSPSFVQDLPPGSTLEGYLFPDSYPFQKSTDPSTIIQQMLDDFDRRVTPDLRAAYAKEGLTLQQAVTLASIVEREAVVPAERPRIAGVYFNRLHRKMRLQADPTVQYALIPADQLTIPAGGYWKQAITDTDLAIISPYNTYQQAGLPPGPICNPGLASIEAVAHPEQNDYLYFVARANGTHLFAKTLAEHEANVQKVRNGE